MVNAQAILKRLSRYFVYGGEATVDKLGRVSVTGHVTLKGARAWTKLPCSFLKVDGFFVCSNNLLETLEGAPEHVGQSFRCWNNKLQNLNHAPKYVGEDYVCGANPLATLVGVPEAIGGDFNCMYCNLTSLQGGPKIVQGGFWCSNNKLPSLDYCPTEVYGVFHCENNLLTSLEHAPQTVTTKFAAARNKLQSLEGLPPRLDKLTVNYNSHLPLLRALGAKHIDWWGGVPITVREIFDKYAGQGKRAMFDCQKELEDAGFGKNARW